MEMRSRHEASGNNGVLLSKISRTMIEARWHLTGKGLMVCFLMWTLCGVLVLADDSGPILARRKEHLSHTIGANLKVKLTIASKDSVSREDIIQDASELKPEILADEEKRAGAASSTREGKSLKNGRKTINTDHRTSKMSAEEKQVLLEEEAGVKGESTHGSGDIRPDGEIDEEKPDISREDSSAEGTDRGSRSTSKQREVETRKRSKGSGGSGSEETRQPMKNAPESWTEESVSDATRVRKVVVPDAPQQSVKSRPMLRSSTAAVSEDQGSAVHASSKNEPDTVPGESDAQEVVEVREDEDLIPEYNLGEPITDWDRERQQWLEEHPDVSPYTDDGRKRIFLLTGTQPTPCANPDGDHLLLRCFKNKVDYARLHGLDMFYNMALLDPNMPTFWAKLPVVRATMLSHPEAEWIWWLDADAIVTDMEFEIPVDKYDDYNMVVHGWESLIFEKRSWLGLNAGSFLLRNCQWSMELLERWASMGPQAPMGEAYRDILSDFLPDRPRNPTDDQAALVYLMIKERERWAEKLRVELEYLLSGYWLELMDGFEATEERYRELGLGLGLEGAREEKVAVREARERRAQVGVRERRPFITHFTGCQPCSGHHNTIYSAAQCRAGLVRALNYGDDQVLRALGYQHRALHLPDVRPLLPNPP